MAKLTDVQVPDIGDFDDVEVVEVLVTVGDRVEADQSLITIESEKASMEVPSPTSGTVRELDTKVGDKVKQGSLIAKIEADEADDADDADESDKTHEADERAGSGQRAARAGGKDPAERKEDKESREHRADPEGQKGREDRRDQEGQEARKDQQESENRHDQEDREDRKDRADREDVGENRESRPALTHASPSVRQLARELGVDLAQVPPSGRKQRIVADDVRRFVKATLQGARDAGALPALPAFDPERFGPVEIIELSKINRLTARNVHRSWLHIPHVTHHDEADITELEAFRRAQAASAEAKGFKLTFLAFLVRAAAAALLRFPRLNASLLPDGERLALRRYVNIGVAVDTPEGLVVPVVRDADQKGLLALAEELADISRRARERSLKPQEMQGATFTISSLGGIGGTGFTPIVNWPEVAILGVSRATTKPVHVDGTFVPRLLLPLSLSYDHRVIDGAVAARFTRHLAELLEDLRRALL